MADTGWTQPVDVAPGWRRLDSSVNACAYPNGTHGWTWAVYYARGGGLIGRGRAPGPVSAMEAADLCIAKHKGLTDATG